MEFCIGLVLAKENMQRQKYYLIIVSLCFVAVSHSMDNTKKINIFDIQEIRVRGRAYNVEYISNESIIFSDFGGCKKFNIKNETTELIIGRNNYQYHPTEPILHHEDQKIYFSADGTVTMYDLKTGDKSEYSPCRRIISAALFPTNNSIFLLNDMRPGLMRYDYVKQHSEDISNGLYLHHVIINPQKKIMYGVESYKISVCSITNLNKVLRSIALPKQVSNYGFCQRNADCSYMAIGDIDTITTVSLNDSDEEVYKIDCPNNKQYTNVAFYPDSSIVGILSIKNPMTEKCAVIDYWCLKNKKYIVTDHDVLGNGGGTEISFSPNGLYVAAALSDRCVRTSVPSEIREIAIKKYILLRSALCPLLPEDIAKYLLSLYYS